jgi:hypothetical protein
MKERAYSLTTSPSSLNSLVPSCAKSCRRSTTTDSSAAGSRPSTTQIALTNSSAGLLSCRYEPTIVGKHSGPGGCFGGGRLDGGLLWLIGFRRLAILQHNKAEKQKQKTRTAELVVDVCDHAQQRAGQPAWLGGEKVGFM